MGAKIVTWGDKNALIEALRHDEIIAFPTETVYGLAALATSKKAFEKLNAIKRRPAEKPFTLMCSSLGQAAKYAEIDVKSLSVMKKYFPGELTVILTARKGIPSWMDLGTGMIGIRIPDSQEALDLIDKLGVPLLVPSANRSGEPPIDDFKEIADEFKDEIYFVVEGQCLGGKPSTIVSMPLNGDIKLVREGPIPFNAIDETYHLGRMVVSVGSDHGAFELKKKIFSHLEERGFFVWDEGTFSLDSCDYPEFGKKVAYQVASNKAAFGIICCTSGEGICMAANKVKGIRCGIGYDDEVTAKCREHNNANMISFGAKYMKEEDVLRRVDIFLLENFSKAPRHAKRVAMIEEN